MQLGKELPVKKTLFYSSSVKQLCIGTNLLRIITGTRFSGVTTSTTVNDRERPWIIKIWNFSIFSRFWTRWFL